MTEGVVVDAALEGQLKQAAGRDVDRGRHAPPPVGTRFSPKK